MLLNEIRMFKDCESEHLLFFFWLDSHVCWLEHVEKPTTNPSPTTRGSDAGSGSGGGNLLVLAGRFLTRIAGFSRENIH